jgi:hypothetical protein
MSNVQSVISEFTSKLEVAIRADALSAITAQLNSQLGGKPISQLVAKAPAPAPVNGTPVRARKSRKGSKRTPAELAATQKKIQSAIVASGKAGMSAEQVQKALGVELSVIQLPITKLLGEKAIRKTGQKRSTRYFAAK